MSSSSTSQWVGAAAAAEAVANAADAAAAAAKGEKKDKKDKKDKKVIKTWGKRVEEEMPLAEMKRRIWAAMPPPRVALSRFRHVGEFGKSDDYGWPPSADTVSAEQARDVRVFEAWVQHAVAERLKRRMAMELGRDLIAAEQTAAEEWSEEEEENDGEQ
jgi:hypothetical protein